MERFLIQLLAPGGLIAAAVIAGADARNCYGIELDPNIIKITKARLARLGVPPWNIKIGDALVPESYEFDDTNKDVNFINISMKDLGMSKFEINLTICKNGNKADNKKFKLNLLGDDNTLKTVSSSLWSLFQKLDSNNYLYIGNEKLNHYFKIFNAMFKKYLGKTYSFSNNRMTY